MIAILLLIHAGCFLIIDNARLMTSISRAFLGKSNLEAFFFQWGSDTCVHDSQADVNRAMGILRLAYIANLRASCTRANVRAIHHDPFLKVLLSSKVAYYWNQSSSPIDFTMLLLK